MFFEEGNYFYSRSLAVMRTSHICRVKVISNFFESTMTGASQLSNQSLEVNRQFLWLDSHSTWLRHDQWSEAIFIFGARGYFKLGPF